ncbi:MAG: protein-methionine-sulfoxide reductase catalytic subunit MsrP [Terriglobales bacterium]
MLIKKNSGLNRPYSEVTPASAYFNRRKFLHGLVAAAASSVVSARAFGSMLYENAPSTNTQLSFGKSQYSDSQTPTPLKYITGYNNYYEFGADKDEPAKYAGTLKTRPWTVSIEGEVKNRETIDIDALMKLAPLEERIYRHRCVEGWSMVIPWIGFPLSTLIRRADPTSKAKFVQFFTLFDSHQMPKAGNLLEWPYREGLRLDEAMHPLTILVFGLYGELLPNQNGAPVRIHVPWKYGFKSAKSIVKIRFLSKQPETTWNTMAPTEYGFYSNVNPGVDHPRWTQATERVIGAGLFSARKPTEMFNGYGNLVASMYAGMDLKKNF